MKYRFRLEKALHFTRLRETMKKMEVASVVQRIEFLKGRSHSVQQTLRALLGDASLSPDPTWAFYQTSKISKDAEDLTRFEKMLRDEEVVLIRLRNDLGRLSMRRKALESLKEKRLKEFEMMKTRKQQLELDEAFRLLAKKH